MKLILEENQYKSQEAALKCISFQKVGQDSYCSVLNKLYYNTTACVYSIINNYYIHTTY